MACTYFQHLPFFLANEVGLRSRSQNLCKMHSTPIIHFGGIMQCSADAKLLKYKVPWMSINASNLKIDSLVDKAERNEERQLLDSDVNIQNELQNKLKPTKKRAIKGDIEIERRRKIGLANKGKTPWNKGRQHSQETREKIRRRTREALRDPKVRKKMSEAPHSHSEWSKAKISSALRKIWEERLKHRELQAKCYLTWSGVIAEAARKGSLEQQELEWDSFEKMDSEILTQHLQWKADKAREKEIAKRRAQRAAKAKVEKMARHVQEKPKAKKSKENLKQTVDKKTVMPISGDIKLRARLAKIRRKQLLEGHRHKRDLAAELQASTEKWDLEFIKREKMQETVSFADQILALKKQELINSTENVSIPMSSRFLSGKNKFV